MKKKIVKKSKKKKLVKKISTGHSVREAINQILCDQGEQMLMADGFEDALVALTLSQPGRPLLAVYDFDKCVSILMKRDGMGYDEAVEFLDFNTVGAWMGGQTPIFINTVKRVLEQNGMEDVLKKKKK